MKLQSLVLATLLCTAAAAAFGAESAAMDATPPRPSALRPLRLPHVETTSLPNGLTVEIVEDHRIPLVTIRLYVPSAGSIQDAAGEEGTAEAMAATMTDGAPGWTSARIARRVAALGGSLRASAGFDGATVSSEVLSENFPKLFEVLEKVALSPTFPDEEIAIYRSNAIQKLALARSRPQFLADVRSSALLFGANPYSRVSPTEESLRGLTRQRIAGFYGAHFGPTGSLLVICGDVSRTDADRLVRRAFGRWSAPAARAEALPEPPKRAARTIALVERPGSVQATLDFKSLAPRAAEASYFPMLVANRILGGGAASRLFLDIREKRSYTYNPFSSFTVRARAGIFEAGCDARNEVAAPAFGSFLENFDSLAGTPASAAELDNAKTYLNGTFALRFATQSGVAGQLVAMKEDGLPIEWLGSYRDRVSAVTAEQAREAARHFVDTPDSVAVIVGDPSLAAGLSKYGAIEFFDVDGRTLPPPAPAAAAPEKR